MNKYGFEFVNHRKTFYITNFARAKAYGFRQYPSQNYYLQVGRVICMEADKNDGRCRFYSISSACLEIICKMYAEGSIKIIDTTREY